MKEIKIIDFLPVNCISLDLKSTSKIEILEELVNLISNSENIKDKEECFDALLCRETLGSTGIGRGIAIPHAKTNGAKDLTLGLGISREGIEFDSMDLNKVNIFFIFASPFNKGDLYLNLLSRISRLVRNDSVKTKVLDAKTAEEIIEILKEEDKKLI